MRKPHVINAPVSASHTFSPAGESGALWRSGRCGPGHGGAEAGLRDEAGPAVENWVAGRVCSPALPPELPRGQLRIDKAGSSGARGTSECLRRDARRMRREGGQAEGVSGGRPRARLGPGTSSSSARGSPGPSEGAENRGVAVDPPWGIPMPSRTPQGAGG